MNKEIVIDINRLETRVALLEDGELAELFIERKGHERLVGNIYKGIVQNVLPGMQAAFVDIGLPKNAFLYARDVVNQKANFDEHGEVIPEEHLNIKELVQQGQEIIVQVFKEPGGSKGTRVTTNITLPGRALVLMPTVNYVGISRRIVDEEEREKLKNVLTDIVGDEMGVIARTVAINKTKEELETEFRFLKSMWKKLTEKSEQLNAPWMVHSEESLLHRSVRDMLNADIDMMIVNNSAAYDDMRFIGEMLVGDLVNKIKYYDKVEPIYETYNIEYQADRATNPKVWLKSGGYIIIDATEAMTVIDVNTGKYVGDTDFPMTALTTNLEAAKEVAKQMRLRNLSGIVVVDFIDMPEESDRELVLTMLEEFLSYDKTKTAVVGMSDLGLVEITRKKERMSLSSITEQSCPYCNGTGRILNNQSIILQIYKALEKIVANTDKNIVAVKLHENVMQSFDNTVKDLFKDINGIERKNIILSPTYGIHEEKFEILTVNSSKEINWNKMVDFIS